MVSSLDVCPWTLGELTFGGEPFRFLSALAAMLVKCSWVVELEKVVMLPGDRMDC